MSTPQVPAFLELVNDHGFALLQQSWGSWFQGFEIVGKGPVQFMWSDDRADHDRLVKIFGPATRRFRLESVLGHLGEPTGNAEAGFLIVARRLATEGVAMLDGLASDFGVMDWGESG